MKKISIIMLLFAAMLSYSDTTTSTNPMENFDKKIEGSFSAGVNNFAARTGTSVIGSSNKVGAGKTSVLGNHNVISPSIRLVEKMNSGVKVIEIEEIEGTGDAGASTIIGNGNTVTKHWVNIMGNSNKVHGINSKIIGRGNTVNSNEVFILGNEITADVEEAIYLGKGATAEEDKTERSAGNTNYSSQDVTITNGSISKTLSLTFAGASEDTRLITIGSEGKERRIQNVAPGLISDKSTDAINGSQLYATINQFAGDINGLGNNVNIATSGVASTAAMANLPQVSNISGHRHNIAGAYGYYNREHAFALGLSGLNETGNIVYKASGSLNTKGHVSFGAGIGYQFDKLFARSDDKLTLQKNGNINILDEKVYKLTKENEELKNSNKELKNELSDLKKEIEMIKKLIKR